MPRLVPSPTRIPVPGDKQIDEYIGRVNTKDAAVSIAHMHSPSGWSEPGQQPEFDEYTVVLKGSLHVESKSGVLEVKAGQAVIAPRGEWVRYSTPGPEGAEYIAVCLAAFDPATVHRDEAPATA
jgi:mannose-6-phosphate isomerase-like protein (cupin superfamily)